MYSGLKVKRKKKNTEDQLDGCWSVSSETRLSKVLSRLITIICFPIIVYSIIFFNLSTRMPPNALAIDPGACELERLNFTVEQRNRNTLVF